MCGIAGFFAPRPGAALSEVILREMIRVQSHRGPDAEGFHLEEGVGLGHARLSIIDLACGAQPLSNEDGTLWITYNGEVFNYIELRVELEGKGHRFRTRSDTEVLVHLLEEEGTGGLSRLNGQFAFALWDSRGKTLLLARDRLGIRPLHFVRRGRGLAFASEARALLPLPGVSRDLDPVALAQTFTFWTTLPGRTAFKGVEEIPPGHFLVVRDGEFRLERWWEPPFGKGYEERPLGEAAEEVAALLDDAVRLRLRADVPVGCYLSGGLDSSLTTTLAKERHQGPLMTFGVRFRDKAFDEGDFQGLMVRRLGTDHTEVTVGDGEIGGAFAHAVRHAERPLLRTAPVPLLLLSRVVRDRGFKVVLTGEGADEFFGGYDIFKEGLVRRFVAREPGSPSRPRLLERLYPDIFRDAKSRAALPAFFRVGLGQAEDPLFSHLPRWENTRRIWTSFSEGIRSALGGYDPVEELRGVLPGGFGKWDLLSRAQYLETILFLSNYLLSSQGDRVAMANSVEIRLPFLDYRVVETSCKIPPWWKILGMREKHILKKAFRDRLPAEVLQRPKQPYRAPVGKALLASEEVRGGLSREALAARGIFDPAKVGRLVEKMERSPAPSEVDSMALAGIASTQLLSRP